MTNETAERLWEELVVMNTMKGMSIDNAERHAERIINKVLDVIVIVAESERLHDNTGDSSDTGYNTALNDVIGGINKLRPKQ